MSSLQTDNADALKKYYRLHSTVYDLTRWSFLFGRGSLMKLLATHPGLNSVLEVGCGTGTNLLALARQFPNANLTGVDISTEMLDIARKKLSVFDNRTKLLENQYQASFDENGDAEVKYDLVLFSYSLSMFNPGWESAIRCASSQVKQDGLVAVVDFHGSDHEGFRNWMGFNHVKMEEHLVPVLRDHFSELECRVKPAYGGLWHYFQFVGRPVQ